MYQFVLFLHILGSLALGFYLILPFVLGPVFKLATPAQEGAVTAVRTANRFGQYGLVIQLLSGGYMMSKEEYPVAWMVIVVVLFVAAGALSGIIGKPLRLAIEGIRQKKEVQAHFNKVRTLSTVLAIVVLLIVFVMVYPNLFA
ncbi:hypothetical protein [Paenibacillus shirakamiensis]|uniref:hypothetical protein n=1 Tax=Paenibacillus shirakamiensis TaxID=1265935 RepID=UPI001AE53A34